MHLLEQRPQVPSLQLAKNQALSYFDLLKQRLKEAAFGKCSDSEALAVQWVTKSRRKLGILPSLVSLTNLLLDCSALHIDMLII